MTPLQVDLLELTLRELRRAPAFAAGLFYGSLFTQRPALRALLGSASDHDGKRLLSFLTAASAGLSDPRRFVALLTLLAQPAVRDRLDDRECLFAIRDAIHSMLAHYLAEFYTAEVQEAWQAAYRRFLEVAQNGLSADRELRQRTWYLH